MNDKKQVFAVVGLIALIAAAIVIAFMATKGAAPMTDVEKIQQETKKDVPKDLGAVPEDQASGDAMMMGGGAKKSTAPPPGGGG
jgi:hypothetical protein